MPLPGDWGSGFIVITVGRLHAVAALLATAQALLLHEAGDAVASMARSTFAQFQDDARAAIGLTAAGMDVFDLLGQRLVLHRPRAGRVEPMLSVVIAARRDVQSLTKRPDGMMAFHRVDPSVPLGGGSERMPNVFKKNVTLLSPPGQFAPGGIQSGVQVGGQAGLCPLRKGDPR